MRKKSVKRGPPKLFGPRDDWQHNACINFARDSWDLYACGYKEAADILVENVLETQSHQDLLVYPIIYSYRQYLELRLKIIIRDSNLLLDIKQFAYKTHDLNYLWGKANKLVQSIFKGEDVSPLYHIGKIIKEFNMVDPESMSFRYPIDIKGNNSLPDIKHINIIQFQERFMEVAGLVEGISCALSEYLSYKAEMAGYYS